MTVLKEYHNRKDLISALANQVALELTESIEQRGYAVLAVPGGTTPGPFFELLSEQRIKWANVKILPTDERFVDETSERSNARLIRKKLLKGPASKAEFLSLFRDTENPEKAVELVRSEIEKILPLDVCILGMGDDMHTASLFPKGEGLELALSENAPPIMATKGNLIPETRLTLTAPILRAAKHIHVLITGRQKKDALSIATEPGSWMKAPIRCVLQEECPTIVHFAD